MSNTRAGRSRRSQARPVSAINRRGQSIVEYAVLVAAVAFGVSVVANMTYRSFVANAQHIERLEMVF